MKIIIWLWNYPEKYNNTRHNVWFMFLDFLKNNKDFWDFRFESKLKAEVSSWIINWEKTLLIKPQTYMNLSWESLISIKNFYKLENEDFLIIYDDMSLDFWKIRFRESWSAWWHNGIKDIISKIWMVFDRIKIWVWFDDKFEVYDWILYKFKEDEIINLENEVFKKVVNLLIEKV